MKGMQELPFDQIVHDLAVAYVTKTTRSEITPAEFFREYQKAFEQIHNEWMSLVGGEPTSRT